MKKILLLGSTFCMLIGLYAQSDADAVLKKLDSKAAGYGDIAQEIWGLAEMGYQEEKSSALLQATLQKQGFSIKTGVAGIPTAFIAEYGSGSPIIAVLGNMMPYPDYHRKQFLCKKQPGKLQDMPVDITYLVRPPQQRLLR